MLLLVIEVIAASTSLLNRVLVNRNPDSFWAWFWQMICNGLSAYLAFEMKLYIWTALEVWAFVLSGALFAVKFTTVSKKVKTWLQLILTGVTALVCMSILFVWYGVFGTRLIAEFVSAIIFMIGLILLITDNRYGHLLFATGNVILGITFFCIGMKVYPCQQIISAGIVVCTFLGYKIDFFKFKIKKL